jgi:hypothetical protein
MVIAALVTFAILLIAWIVAPTAPRRAPHEVISPDATSPELAEPIAA